MEPPHEEQYSEYFVESNPRAYMTIRDYRNLAWKNQQPWERNPNPPRSMRDYRDQWMSAPSYMVPPQYASLSQPQPPQPISQVEQAILDLTKLVGDAVGEQKKFNAQLSQKIYTVENPLEQTLDEFQSEVGQQVDSLQYSNSKLAQQLDHQGEENPEDECLTETNFEEQAQLQPQEELKVESVEAPPEELQDAPQLGIVYGPWKKEEEILPLLSEESNGKEAGEEPQKPITQATNSSLPSPVYTLPTTQFTPAAQFTPQAPTTKATPSLLVLQNIRKLVATVQASATTSKTQAAAYIAWHSGWFECRFGFGAPESRHF